MEVAVQSTVRCSISTKKSGEKPAEKLFSQIIEESKHLEHLNRKISKSNGRNIIKEISVFRKITPEPSYFPQSTLYPNINYETKPIESLKLPLKPLKSSQARRKFDSLFTETLKKKQEFYDVPFKSHLWPEDSIIDDKMFELLNGQDVKKDLNIWVDIKPKYNIQIKSRIREFERNIGSNFRKITNRVQQRGNFRSSSPWTYAGDCRSVMATPFISVSKASSIM